MKKFLVGATILLGLALAGCSSSSNDAGSNQSSTSESTTTAPTAKNKAIAKEVAAKFNTNGETMVKVSVQTDVVDEQSKTNKNGDAQPHQIIDVRLVDPEGLKNMKAAKDALDSNSATDDQKTAIAGTQTIIADEAKKLENDYDTIQLGWQLEDADNIQLVALSTRKENIISIVE